MSIFYKGKAGRKKSHKVDEEAREERASGGKARRFWLKPGKSTVIILLDDLDFFLWEHNLRIGGKFYNFFTCVKDSANQECHLCREDKSYFMGVCSVIDTAKFKSEKTGKVIKNQKKLLCLKNTAREVMLRRHEELQEKKLSFKYACFKVSRGMKKNECATGEDFQYIKHVTKKALLKAAPDEVDPEKWIKPVNYEKYFEAVSEEKMRRVAGLGPPTGSDEDQTGMSIEDELGLDEEEEKDDDLGLDDDTEEETGDDEDEEFI